MSCGDLSSTVKDNDGTAPQAKMLAPGIEISDKVDFSNGDSVDWKKFSYFSDATVTVRYVLGGIGEKNNMTGEIEIFDLNSNKIAGMPLEPNKNSYKLSFEAKAKATYFIRLKITKGAGNYMVRADAKVKKVDPCEKCTANEKCIDKKCIPLDQCYPACEAGFKCVEGTCEKAKIVCKRGSFFSKRLHKCIKNPCYHKKCGANQKCRWGKCVNIKVKAKKSCFPPCKKGQTCDAKTLKCKAEAKTGTLNGRILSFSDNGNGGTVLIINKGKKHGLKKGMKGRLQNGAKAKLIEVYPYRSKASVKLPPSKFKTNMGITFKF